MSAFIAWLIGTIGNFAFGIKSMFQIHKTLKTKTATDISTGMLVFDFIGNVMCAYFMFYTGYSTGVWLWPQFVNYGLATIGLMVLLYLKHKYK